MNKLIIFILFFGHVGDFFSQHAFYKELETTKSWEISSMFEVDGNFILSGWYYDKVDFLYKNLIIKTNNSGDIIEQKIDSNTKFSYIKHSFIKNDTLYFLGLKKNENLQNEKLTVWKYSKDLHFIDSVSFGDSTFLSNDNNLGGYHLLSDGILIANSTFGGDISTDAQLLKTDYSSNILWNKKYFFDTLYSTDYFKNVSVLENKIILNMTSMLPNNAIPYSSIIFTDNTGNEFWRKRIDNYKPINIQLPTEQSALNLIKNVPLDNGNLLSISELYRDYTNLSNKDLIFIEFDNLGNEINAKIIPFNRDLYLKDAQFNEQKELILTGTYTFDDSSLFNQFIAKLDINLNLIWLKEYGTDENSETNYCSISTSDGGYLLAGERFRYIPTAGYNIVLVKTDCEGNLEWNNSSCQLPSENEMVIFPNPTISDLIIQCAELEINTSTKLKIFDNIGQLVYEDIALIKPIFTINTSQFSQGIYFCEIKQNEKILNGKFVKVE